MDFLQQIMELKQVIVELKEELCSNIRATSAIQDKLCDFEKQLVSQCLRVDRLEKAVFDESERDIMTVEPHCLRNFYGQNEQATNMENIGLPMAEKRTETTGGYMYVEVPDPAMYVDASIEEGNEMFSGVKLELLDEGPNRSPTFCKILETREKRAKKAKERRQKLMQSLSPEQLREYRNKAARKAKEQRKNLLNSLSPEQLREYRNKAARKAKEQRENLLNSLSLEERLELENTRRNIKQESLKTNQPHSAGFDENIHKYAPQSMLLPIENLEQFDMEEVNATGTKNDVQQNPSQGSKNPLE